MLLFVYKLLVSSKTFGGMKKSGRHLARGVSPLGYLCSCEQKERITMGKDSHFTGQQKTHWVYLSAFFVIRSLGLLPHQVKSARTCCREICALAPI